STGLYREQPLPTSTEEARKPVFMHHNDREAMSLFKRGKFEIVRKPPAQVLSMRRIVFDNDHQARDLTQSGFPPRWAPEKDDGKNLAPMDIWRRRQAAEQHGGWQPQVALGFRHAPKQGSLDWLRYRHLLAPRSTDEARLEFSPESIKPELITDFLA